MDKVLLEINYLINNLKPLLPLANHHMVKFITDKMFESFLPKPIQEEIMAMSVKDLNRVFVDSFSNRLNAHQKENAPYISEFLSQTHMLALNYKDVCLPVEKLLDNLGFRGHNEHSSHVVKNFMSVKKSYEVELMSGVIAAVAKTRNYSHIIDIGGGKGYLSSILALQHNLKVLSVDSSFITSKGAEKQIPKMEKLWNNLQRKSKPNNEVDTTVQYDSVHQESSQVCKLATLYITEETDIVETIKDNFKGDEIGEVMLIGLHTCGNLAATSLRLFVNSPEHIRCLVNVGCCYNLILEEFDTTPPWLDVRLCASGVGFPMSKYLRDMHFVLGHNARMLATQPIDKILHDQMLSTEVFFYRALLELYLEKKLCPIDGLPRFKIGKLAKKCSSFEQYVHKSIKRLGLDIEVDDDELRQLYDSNSDARKQLHGFYLLRVALAPAIEAVIMLDRLLYLKEQGIEEAYLTQLFDPVVSPRCYAIIAFNRSLTKSTDSIR